MHTYNLPADSPEFLQAKFNAQTVSEVRKQYINWQSKLQAVLSANYASGRHMTCLHRLCTKYCPNILHPVHRVTTSKSGWKISPRDTTWGLMQFLSCMPSKADILPAMYVNQKFTQQTLSVFSIFFFVTKRVTKKKIVSIRCLTFLFLSGPIQKRLWESKGSPRWLPQPPGRSSAGSLHGGGQIAEWQELQEGLPQGQAEVSHTSGHDERGPC